MVANLQTREPPSQADFHAAITDRSDRWFAACLKITRNRAMAEDAVQDALLNAWNKRHQFDNTARLDTWIHRIAVNAALQLLRKNRPAAFEPLETGNGPVEMRVFDFLDRALWDDERSLEGVPVRLEGLGE